MTGMLIAGERTEGAAGEGLDVVNPANEETIESVPRGTAADVDAAVEAADKAFAEWSKTDAEDRANLLRKAIALIERDRKDLTMSLVHEQGKPVTEAGGEVHHMIHGLNYYADLATKVRGSYQALPSALSKAYGMVLRRPMGVVAAIVPNNFPLTLLGHEAGARADGRQHDRGQARGDHAADHAEDRRPAARGRDPARRRERDHGQGLRGRRRARHPRQGPPRRVHRAPPRSAATSWAWPRRS